MNYYNAVLHNIFLFYIFIIESTKKGGLYYMGGTYIYFFHPKWSKLCTAPLMNP